MFVEGGEWMVCSFVFDTKRNHLSPVTAEDLFGCHNIMRFEMKYIYLKLSTASLKDNYYMMIYRVEFMVL